MRYRLPELTDRDILEEYVREHLEHGETSISASEELASTDYAAWVRKIHENALSHGDEWGPSLHYLCFDGDRLVGLLGVRYGLSERLTNIYGDIGYGVRPSERKKGYATEMLRYGLSVCREKGKKRVIVGCFKDNTASASVIRKNGGVLLRENDNYQAGRMSQYYLIQPDNEERNK